MPSSLVTRTRNGSSQRASSEYFVATPYSLFAFCNLLHSAHIGLQHVRHSNRSVAVLIGFHHCDQSAPDGDARTVERVNVTNIAVLAAIARIHASRLEIAAHRAR